MIDTHAHLSDTLFESDLVSVLERGRLAGVNTYLSVATSLSDSKKVVALTQKYKEIYGVLGIYPGCAHENNYQSEVLEIKKLIITNPKIVGVGEIGLDYESYRVNPTYESEMFEMQMDLALELGLPVVVHTRGTQSAMLKILNKRTELPPGHFHCFSGEVSWLERVLELGFYIGFDANVGYKNANYLRDLVRRVPIERLLLETDSPYLPPEGLRGTRNEPANVRITSKLIAELKNISFEELVAQTSKNASILFKLKS